MNKKEILIICLIMCIICSVSVVSAADANGTDKMTTQDLDVVSSSNVSAYSLPDSNQVLQDGSEGAGNFSDLQRDISGGGTVTLERNYTYDDDKDSSLKTGIVITSSMTIQAKEGSKIVIDAKKLARVFTIQPGATVYLKGITFVNGYSINTGGTDNPNGHGGSIWSKGTVHIDNCNFINSTAYAGNGGSVFLNGFGSTITNSYFEGSNTIKTGQNAVGGAVFIAGNNITISHSIFNNNHAGLNGGAIGSKDGTDNCTIINCTIEHNTADGSAGGVGMQSTNFHMYNSTFKYNEAKGLFADYPGNGGGIVLRGSDSSVYNCTFINNTAKLHGGASFLRNTTGEHVVNNIGFELCTFINNTAKNGNGGAISWSTSATNGYVKTSEFTNNTAKLRGGALFWSGYGGVLSYSNFTGNKVTSNATSGETTNIAGGLGGGVCLEGSNITIKYSNFTNNKAYVNGGALIVSGVHSENVTIEHSILTYNEAGQNDGALCWNFTCPYGTIINCTFEYNVAHNSAGAAGMQSDHTLVYNSTFRYNRAIGDRFDKQGCGGAIVFRGSEGYVYNCTFTNNTALKQGGALFVRPLDNENNTHTGYVLCTFINNTAGINGGAVNWFGNAYNGYIYNATFINNTAKRSGGAVYWSGHGGTITHSNFTGNKALGIAKAQDAFGNPTFGGDGGAVIWIGPHGSVDDCRFIDNEAAKRGGAVYLQGTISENCTDTNFTNVYFRDNVAGTNGGAVDWNKGAHDGLVDNATFINNVAKRSGGAIYWNGNTGTIQNSNFTGNKALGINNSTDAFGVVTYGGDGGAVIWIGSEGTVDNCRFIDNEACKRGGAVYLQGTSDGNCENTNFINSYFRNNTAGTNGGAIDWNKGAHDGLVDNTQFINNTANRSGGAIYWNGHNGTIQNSNFTGNKALGIALANTPLGEETYGGDGGAVIWSGALGTVDNCRFINNTAAKRGGGVYLQGSEAEPCENTTFMNSLFENNVAGTNGGAVDWYSGAYNGVVDNVTFINNTAKRNGGAIFWHGDNGTVKHSTFKNNRATGEALEYDMSFNMETDVIKVKNKSEIPLSADSVGKLFVVNQTLPRNIAHFESYVVEANSTGGYNLIKLDEIDVQISESIISPVDWAIDQFFGGDGGTILWSGDIGLVYNCTFIDSNSARRGGGAYMTGSDNVTFNNCTFENCTSGTNGGGVDWLAGANYGKIYNSIFKNTMAARSAGAIYYDGWYGEMKNITIINTVSNGGALKTSKDGLVKYAGWDSSHWDTNTTGGDAGAIMFTGSHIYVYNVTFTGCNASGRGGAVFLQDNKNVTFDLCKFENNMALGTANNTYNNDKDLSSGLNKWLTGYGGAIGFDVGATLGIIKHSTFTNNTAVRIGGAISFGKGSSNGTVYNSTFTDNTAYRNGGAIAWDGTNGNMSYCTFTNNAALGTDINREIVDLTSLSQIIGIITTNAIINESLLPTASASTHNKMYIIVKYNETTKKNESYTMYATLKDGDNYFWAYLEQTTETGPSYTDWAMDEYFGGDGGSIYWRGDNGTVDYCNFINSNSARRGGGAYMCGSDHIQFLDSNFTNCTSGTNGGGLDWLAGANYGKVINCIFNNTRAARSAGAIYYDGDYGEMRNITIINATSYGGTLASPDRVTYAGWDSSHWDTNTTGGDAGAIMFTGDHEYIYNATFINCTAQGRGGAVFLQDNKNVTFDLCKFENNEALGIAINTWKDDKSEEDITPVYKYGHGGAVAFDLGATNCTIKNSEFIENYARRDGGAINFAVGAENNTIRESRFINNSAGDDGGSIYIEGANANISASNFTMSMASKNGGAIYVNGLNTTIEKSNFAKNNATLDGGSIYVEGISAKILDSTLIQSHARYGGVLYINGRDAYINGSTFAMSSADNDGGAVYIAGYNATIEKSVFDKNNVTKNGGAIYIKGDLSEIIDSNFTIDIAITGNGGAVYVGGKNTTISGAFTQMTQAPNGNGGAFYVDGVYTVIKDSSLSMSGALTQGGSIYLKGDNSKVLDTNISRTTATTGGAVYIEANNALVSGCNVSMANASKSGGAIYINGINAKVNNSNFNLTNSLSTAAGNGGGAIFIQGAYATVENSNFTQSVANYSGGAIYINGINASVINSKFNKTSAYTSPNNYETSNLGGAINIIGNNAIISLSEFESCSAFQGGDIYLAGSYCTVTNSSFDNSRAYGTATNANGGAIYSTGSYSNIYYSNFTNNVAEGNGGAIFWFGGTATSKYNNIYNCIFINNTAHGKSGYNTRGGGAIYFYENSYYNIVKDSQFINNSAQTNHKADGGAILWDKCYHGLLDGCTFDGNFANSTIIDDGNIWMQGGALFLRARNNFTITNSVFKNCWCDKEGGAFYLANEGSVNKPINTYIINVTFINNTAKAKGTSHIDGGGAILVKECQYALFRNVTFINNTANNGGGLAYFNTRDTNYFENCTFIGNNATNNGGNIWLDKNNVEMYNITMCNGTAANLGGGMYIQNNQNIPGGFKAYNNFTFINNTAKQGGGLYWNTGSVTITTMVFINNTAEEGGAIYIPKDSAVIVGNNFTGNSAFYGGAIYVNVNDVKINNDNFTANDAQYGGAIYLPVSDNRVLISDSSFNENIANYGGAIYNGFKGEDGWYITFSNFTKNTARQDGGAVYLAYNGQQIGSSNFEANNASGYGGAVYVSADLSAIKIYDSTFKNSLASNGGAIYYGGSSSPSLTIENDTFIKNTATHNGGAVLYVTVNGAKVYRDYNNFDGEGVISNDTGRTDLAPILISRSLFENNNDYYFHVEVTSDWNTTYLTVEIYNPEDVNINLVKFVVNITDITTNETQQVIVDESNFYSHYNSVTHRLYVTFDQDLRVNDYYNITFGFKNAEYMYKENSTQAQVHGDIMGEFKYLQHLIDDAIDLGRRTGADFYELNLTRAFRFNPFYFGEYHSNMDDRCLNLTNLDKPFIIYGNGWTLDARGFSRVFNVTASNVTFINVQFANGNASGQFGDNVSVGGAIFWAGENGQLIDSLVYNSYANLGGGIYYNVTALNAKIINSTFINNTAVTNGGAIDCNASEMELLNTEFRGNHAYIGAALCREVNATGGYGFNNTFSENRAVYAGAALAWMNASSIHIDTYYFYDNSAGYSGGAIYVGKGSGNCEIENCVFENNFVDNTTGGHGGAIEWYAEKGLVSNSSFTNNYAYNGGAIYVGSDSGQINVTGSTFTKNHALNSGGAISLDASAVTINQTKFYDNYAVEGGALYVGGQGETNYVYDSVFEGNNATGGNGGAINWIASSGTIINSNLTSNHAYYGGGLYFGGLSANSVVSNCIFTDNHAKYNGGAIDCNSSQMTLTHTLFDGNYAQFGAALCREINALKGSGENNTFKNNHAYISGAALGWMGSVGISITNYTFINNSADFSGGAIYVSPDSHNCSIIDCNFEENYVTDKLLEGNDNFFWNAWNGDLMEFISKTADLTELDLIGKVIMGVSTTTYYHGDVDYLSGVGGAIDILASNATVKKSSFTNNTARLGGAIYVGADNGNTNINDSVFTANHAYERGGAINLHASAVNVNNSKFFDNTAIDGGALFVSGSGITNYVLYSVFEGNNATGGHGGAIEWIASEGYIEASNFTRNSADYGGALYFNGASHNSSVINVRFEGNNATYNGGAIDWDATGGKLYNTTFISNYAGAYGAALCRESGATGGSGKNNTFIANHAGIGGAALAWMGVSRININDYHFINNTANRMGGAIYIAEGSDYCVVNNSYFTGNRIINSTGGNGGSISIVGDDATIINSNFTDNSARYGGAIFAGNSSGNTNISNALFERNHAVQDGGAVHIRGSGVTLNDTRFYNNTADGHGGAIYVGGTGESNVIYYSDFKDNEAGDHGGAINWIASAGEIKYSNFTENSANYGGAVYLNGVSSHSELTNLIFTSNTARENGGAIDCNATMMNLTNTQFISNHAKYGAALCREANATGGFGFNNTFIANEASVSGAALAWLGVSNININNYTFINNTAGISGGAIYVKEGSDNCRIRNSTFENNYVTDVRNGRGGAIDWIGLNGYVEDTVFKDSLAVNGGTIYVAETADNFTVFNTSFISSRALGEGGSLLIYGDNVRVLSSNFTFSLALVQGGSIATHNIKNITIDDCMFDYNVGAGYVDSSLKAYGEGGAIYANNITLINISNSKFSGIESHSNGGAISAIRCNDAILYNLTFNDELTIRNGGAISWINSTNLTIDSSRFNDVSASYYGGAIYLYNMDDATVKNSVFNGTVTPRGNGGAISSDGNTTLRNNTFVNFEAYEDYGGAIFVNSGNSTIEDSRFDGRDAIWVYYNATAYVTNNNVTGKNPNKNMYYLERDYDSKYNPVDYSIWNDGDLYLKDNNFGYVIFNNGTIWTNTTTKLLDNKTWNVTWNENFTYWAQITDDNNNTIISVQTLDTYNDVYQDEGNHYILKYNRGTLQSIYQGTFHLAPIDKGLKQNTIYNGTLNVKMPLSMEVTYSDLTKDTITFTAKITPKVTSNYTISGKELLFRIGDLTFKAPISCNDVAGPIFTSWNISKAEWERNVLGAGTYTVTATFEGDDVHWGVENRTQFTINMRDTWIRIVVNNAVWGQYPIANITTNGNGTVVVSMNGRNERFNITNGSLIVPFDTLYDPGVYYMSVIYLEDQYYKSQFNETNFTIYKQNTTIDATPTNITFWQSENITVNVDKNATGYIKVTIEGQEYVATIVNGTARFTIPNLFGKTYQNVEVLYNGDIHFNGNKTYINFTVGPTSDYTMDVKVNNIEYGQNATVRVKLPTLAEGNVTIYVDGIEWGTVTLNEGTAELSNISGLAGGEHFVNVTYHGGVSYAARNYTDVSFNVTQTNNWKMTITVDEHPYGENTTIHIVTNPYKVTNKNLTITIDGHDYVVNITNGVADLTLNNLSAKVRMATVYYSGDANYTNMSQKFRVQIAKAQPTVNITRVGTDVIATVSGNAIANVTFYINGVRYDNLTVNGNATIYDKLRIGINSVVAIYNENENYTQEINVTTFDISRIGTSLTVVATPESVGVGKNTTITVTMVNVTSGKVLIEINGYNYTANINSSGIARLIVALPVGNYTARAYYLGDNTHFESNNTSNAFNVTDKQNATVTINVDNVVLVDSQLIFNVTNSTPVVVTVNGNVITPVNGNYIFDAGVVGNYTIVARSNETDMYYSGFDTKVFSVVKRNSTVYVSANSIYVNGEVLINITAPDDMDGIVKVCVNNANYTVDIVNGNGLLRISGLGNGTYKVNVTYIENDKYLSSTNDTSFNVSKLANEITIHVENITYGGVAQIIVDVPGVEFGEITIKVNSTPYTLTVINGKAYKNITGLAAGNYTVNATFTGNDDYNATQATRNFTVNRATTHIDIIRSTVNVGDNATIIVFINNENAASGNITIKVNNKTYSAKISSNKAVFTVDKIYVGGTYNVTASYAGDNNFTQASTTNVRGLTVVKVDKYAMNVTATEALVGQNSTITVYVPSDATGNVTIWVNGTKLNATVSEGKAVFYVAKSAAGLYTVNATLSDIKYVNQTVMTKYRVYMHETPISVNVSDIHVGDVAQIIVTVANDTSANVTIEIDGKSYSNITVNGNATFYIADLTAGNKTVAAVYLGDNKYMTNFATENFTVSKHNAVIESIVSTPSVVVGKNTTITVTMGNVTSGKVLIEVNKHNYTADIVDGVATLNVALPIGNYTAKAYYLGDNKYKTKEFANNTEFKVVAKQNATVTINAGNVVEIDGQLIFNVTNSTPVVVTINGKVVTPVNGNYTFDADKVGNYTIVARSAESDDYYAGFDTKTFVVVKHNSTIRAETEDIEVGQTAVINVTGPAGFDGIATVNIAGVNYTVILTNGIGQVNVTGLGKGTHPITVTYLENEKYLSNTNTSAQITVSQVESSVTVEFKNITYGEVAIFDINVTNGATGNVTVKVGTDIVKVIGLVNGKAQLIVPALHVGEYDITVTYNGDDRYKANYTVDKLKVSPSPSDDLEVIDLGNGTVVVTVPANATGNITVKVANNTYNATVRNGSAIINLVNETPGTYNINVTYSGDDDHAGDSTTKYITIPKYGTEISIEVNSTVVGNVTRIIVTVPGNVTENVTIEIDGVKYNRTANGGKAIFDIEGLTAGNKTVTAIYGGDDWYLANSTTKQFAVSKVNSTIYTTSASIDVDGTAVIDVYGPNDYNGTTVVTVNGVNYSVKLTNGVGQVNITGLANGTHPIVVTYLENDKYFESTNDTSSIVVSKVASQVNVTVENINEGEPVIVKVTVPDDATGNVTIKIGSIVKTLPVVGGENELIILDVPAGEYDVNVTYSGNDKYAGDTDDTAKLKVTKAVVDEMKVIDLGNGTVKVVVPNNATGNITVKVGEDIYNATVENGTAVIDLNKTLPGSHEVTATFVGDDGTTKEINATVMIPKYATPISISVSDANVGDNIRIVVTVKGNVTKEVTLEIDGEKYTKEVTNGEAVFEIDTLTAGNKTVTATYDGDDYYLFNSTTGNFTVSKLTAPISVSAVTSANNAVITLSGLPDDATGYVIVKVGDLEYGVNITQTKELTVPLTKSGTYSVDVTYLGDDKYLGNTNSTSFAISIDDKVTIDVHEENYGDDVVVKVTVPEDAKGNITVKIGNTTQVVNVTGGENVITIPDVGSGSHEINVTYSGDSKYDTKTIVKTIYVYSSVNVEDEYTRGWNSPYDYSAEFLDSEGHVIKNTEVKFIVNGKTYTAKTNDQGIAYLTGSNLPVGTYEITTINPVTGQEVTKKVTIVKRILENKDLTKDYLDSKSYSVLVIGDDGKPVGAGEYVAMTINTVTYAVKTNEKGYAVRTIGLVPGSYTITASYKDCTVKNKVKVKQTLKSKSVKVKKSAKKLVLKATLKWSNGKAIAGKKVTFKLNGKTYSAKTNSKGIAQVTIKKSAIKKLKAGKKYTILIKYKDEKVKPKLTVKK